MKFYLLDISISNLNHSQNFAIVMLTEEQSENLPFEHNNVIQIVHEADENDSLVDFMQEVKYECGYPDHDVVQIEATEIFKD